MNGNIFFVHIGLHKTATTSLQKDVFPFVQGVEYIGRSDVALSSQSDLYRDICEFCYAREVSASQLDALRLRIADRLSKGSLLLSDEWFTADYSGCYGFEGAPWQIKLERLSRLIGGVKHKVLVTLRDPLQGLYSQYCEFNSVGVERLYGEFNVYAKFSNDSKAYDYVRLDSFLVELFGNVFYVSFENLVSDDKLRSLCLFLGVERLPKLGRRNNKKKEQGGVVVSKRNTTFEKFYGLVPCVLRRELKKIPFVVALINYVANAFASRMIVGEPSGDLIGELNKIYLESSRFYEKVNKGI
jgi:hypothetical protein